jgi:anti-sigma factor RsiW
MSANGFVSEMTCAELDSFLYAYLDGEFGPNERLDFERHLSQCARCAQRVHLEAGFHETLRQKTQELLLDPALRAPDGLRRAIHASLRQEQHRAFVRSWVRASAAAVALVAASGAYVYLRPGLRERFAEDAALRHSKGLPFEIQQTTPEHFEAWFQGKLDHPVSVLRLPNAKLAGARLSHVKDKQAAYFAYDAAGSAGVAPRRIGLFVFYDAKGEVTAGPWPSVELDSSHGYNVATWRDREIVYELVSDLEETDIRRMLTGAHRNSWPTSPLPSAEVQPASLKN